MAIPYQPTFSIQPRHGFRYAGANFAPPVAPPGSVAPPGLQGSAAAPPPVMGSGAGGMSDPFAGNDGFERAQRNYATDFGYQQGTQNPMGVLGMLPGGMALMNMMGYDPTGGGKYTYGNFGTQDTSGNVFGPSGQAYDPATGRVTSSFGPQVSVGDIFGSAMGQLGWFGYDENDMITPPSMRANQAQMDMGLTDMSYAGLMSVPGEVSILGALDPNKGYGDIAGGRSYNELSKSGTVTDKYGRAVTSTRPDGTKAAVMAGDAYQQAAAQQAYQGASKDMDAGLTEAATQMAGGPSAGAYSGFGQMASDYNANTYDDDDSGVSTDSSSSTSSGGWGQADPSEEAQGDFSISSEKGAYGGVDIDDIEESTGKAYDDPSQDGGGSDGGK